MIVRFDKMRLLSMSEQFDKYLDLAKDIVSSKNRKHLIELLGNFEARDASACKYAQETICNQQELAGGCATCFLSLNNWCGDNPFSSGMKIHALVRLIRESGKPYSDDSIKQAIKLAQHIVNDEKSFRDFKAYCQSCQ